MWHIHPNTKTIIIVLVIIASLLLGINIGRKLPKFATKPSPSPAPQTTPSPTITPTPIPTITPSPTATDSAALGATTISSSYPYNNSSCGYSIEIPDNFLYSELDSFNVLLTNSNDKNDQITILCQENMPRPSIEPKLINSTTLDNIPAELFSEQQPNGSIINVIITGIPNSNLDILLSGSSPAFQYIYTSLRFTN